MKDARQLHYVLSFPKFGLKNDNLTQNTLFASKYFTYIALLSNFAYFVKVGIDMEVFSENHSLLEKILTYSQEQAVTSNSQSIENS